MALLKLKLRAAISVITAFSMVSATIPGMKAHALPAPMVHAASKGTAAADAKIPAIIEQGYSYTSERPVHVYIDSKKQSFTLPILFDKLHKRTLYPFRQLMDSIGAAVAYDEPTDTAIAEYKGITIKFPLNSSTYYVNGTAKAMDTKTILDPSTNRTYIPVRYAFEALGYTVQWIESQKHDEIRIYDLGEYSEVSDEEFLKTYYNTERTIPYYYEFDSKNKQLKFRDEYSSAMPFKDKTLTGKINPDIVSQTYDLVKTLADEKEYVHVKYQPSLAGERFDFVKITYAKGEVQANINAEYFYYTFRDAYYFDVKEQWDTPTFSTKAVITLILSQLYWSRTDSMSDPHYEKKLRDSLIAVFGEETGISIYKYVYGKYIQSIMSENPGYYIYHKESKAFGNVKVDYVRDDSTFNFYFSYTG